MERRKFLQAALAGAAAPGLIAQEGATPSVAHDGTTAGRIPRVSDAGELRGEMLYRKFGSTGEVVSAIGMGGSHIAQPNAKRQESIKLVHQAIDRGITFMDNCWDYNEGRSERWMGEALAESGYRNKVFLMTKIDGRNKENAADQINDSLTRLKTDRIDLLQFHEILSAVV